MSAKRRSPRLLYVLFGAMSLVSFGGPFLIAAVVHGGKSAVWPPDRAIEWFTVILICSLVIIFFLACLTIGWLASQPPRSKRQESR
jgi:hypothetical protein